MCTTVAQLAAMLATMPQDLEVAYVWDGEPRGRPTHVWVSRAGYDDGEPPMVILVDSDEPVYNVNMRPAGAPGEESPYWHSPK